MNTEIIVYNIIFWFSYYWICSLPERLIQKQIDEAKDV